MMTTEELRLTISNTGEAERKGEELEEAYQFGRSLE